MNLVSFELEGDFAAFKDPSVTTNQIVYTIPSKSAVIGLIGALIGIDRPNSLKEAYSSDYLTLLKSTSIGITVNNAPQKVTFFTNHRSLKEPKTKPFKTELLISPNYTIFVNSKDETTKKLLAVLENSSFKYCPTLGHAYCLARIPSHQTHIAKEVDPSSRWTSSVILDEALETESPMSAYGFNFNPDIPRRIMLERHLHHYFTNSVLERRVLRHWIPTPVNGKRSKCQLQPRRKLSLVKFVQLNNEEDEAVCLY